MPWYKSGTVSVTLNSNAVIGTGTAFLTNGRVGDAFRGPDGGWYEVTNIASDTALSISPNYKGATNAAGIYALAPMQGYVKDSADALRSLVNLYGAKLAALGTTGNYDILPVTKGGTGGENQADARAGLGLGNAATLTTVTSNLDATPGRALTVGYGGIGGTGALVTDAETPSAAKGGLYITNTSTTFTPPVGLGKDGYLINIPRVIAGASAQALEIYVDGNTGQMARRVAISNAWKAPGWTAIADGGANANITSLTGLTTQLSLAQGGTGKTSMGAAAVGTVSQSGGVPTGAIIEIGSNANGEYVKFANGTQICRFGYSGTLALDALLYGAYVSGWITWTFPAGFVSRPNVIVTPRDDTALFGVVSTSGNGGVENIRLGQNAASGSSVRSANFVAFGRWF